MTVRSSIYFTAIMTSLVGSGAALASEAVQYQPKPGWVKDMGGLNAAERDAQGLIRADSQQKAEGGTVATYLDIIERASSSEQLAGIGLIKINWHPDHGDLIIHHIDIVRDGQLIDVTKSGAKFTVIRREENLERQAIDGVSTATMQVEGLKVGDFLRLTYSTTYRDAALGGHMQMAYGLLSEPLKVVRASYRAVWPHDKPLHWKVSPATVAPIIGRAGAYDELVITQPLPKPQDRPAAAPLRFTPPRLFEASDFDSWADVVKTSRPLYATDGLIAKGSPLAAQVAKIAAMSTDPKVRAAEALRVVQDDVRYLMDGEKEGNYTPQSPAETWTKRYGDCKAKTLLLVAMLRELGIEADAALASIGLGDLIPGHLPAYQPFNHVTVRAVIGGKVYYLEGTTLGTRLADLDSPPDYHYVLPLRDGVTAPEAVPFAVDTRPQLVTETDVDASLGLGLPSLFKTKLILRGAASYSLHRSQSSLEPKKFDDYLDRLLSNGFASGRLTERSVTFDDANATATIIGEGIDQLRWETQNEHRQLTLPSIVSSFALGVDRNRPEWKDIPVAVPNTRAFEAHYTITLPHQGTGFKVENGDNYAVDVAGRAVTQAVRYTAPVLHADETARATTYELPAAKLPEERAKLARYKATPLKIIAPADYSPAWKEAREAFKAGKLKPIEAAFSTILAHAEADDVSGLMARAQFRQFVGDRDGMIADLSSIIAKKPTLQLYLMRAEQYKLYDPAKALGDIAAARSIDPTSLPAVSLLMDVNNKRRDFAATLAVLDDTLPLVEDKSALLSLKAQTLAEAGRSSEALDILNTANAEKPGNVELLNGSCWTRAIANAELPVALKDCTKAIELSQHPSNILDSRAFVYYRLGRYEDAIADDDAALKMNPGEQHSLYVRGLARLAKGDAEGQADLKAARELQPDIDAEYARFGVKPKL